MSDFAGEVVGTAVELAVDDDACALACSAGEVDQGVGLFVVSPDVFGECGGVGVVFDVGWDLVEGVGDGLDGGDVDPVREVGRRHDEAAWPGDGGANGDACGGGLLVGGVFGEELFCGGYEVVECCIGIGGGCF